MMQFFYMAHILITGANGQVGSEIDALSIQYPEFDLFFADRADLDITKEEEIARFLDRHPFQYLINAAAYTAVDKAETEPELARKVNTDGPRLLAKACRERDIALIHYSTDYVYHTEHNRPYKEDDFTAPKGVYAQTKLEGDLAVLENTDNGMIIRTSWVYSSFGHNFVKTMLRLGKERDQLNIVFDQIGSPTYARDLAKASLDIIQKSKKEDLKGIYHYSNEGVCSWYDFALAIFEIAGIECIVRPIESKDYPTPAERPPFSVLNKGKMKEDFGLVIPHWRESLAKCIGLLKK
jgi:dTDP-4-dehydrorhamnose reductase